MSALCAERSTGKSVANFRADQSFIIYDSRYTTTSHFYPGAKKAKANIPNCHTVTTYSHDIFQ